MKLNTLKHISKKTFLLDLMRAPSEGVIRAFAQPILLIIAIDFYQAGDLSKSIISAGTYIGFVLCPLLPSILKNIKTNPSLTLTILQLLATLVTLIPIFIPTELTFVLCMTIALALLSLRPFLITSIYKNNYSSHERGKLFSSQTTITLIFTILTISLVNNINNSFLKGPQLLIFFLVAVAIPIFLFYHYPTFKIKSSDQKLNITNILKTDKLFVKILIIWFIFGFANLATVPLRTAFLMEAQYGFEYSFGMATFIMGTVVPFSQLVFTPLMGRLFDKFNFIDVRIFINFLLMLSMILFFLVGGFWGFISGNILLGLGYAGGNIAWNLWVTRLTKPENTENYMIIHQFLTGARGLTGPILAFQLTAIIGVMATTSVAVLLVMLSILMLIPLRKHGERFNN